MKIPRIFHQVWFGDPMPEPFVSWSRTWKACHPDFELRTWTEKDDWPDSVRSLMDRACNLSQVSNIARYVIIEREGGIYVDSDFECQRSIVPLIKNLDAFAAYQLEPDNPMGVAPINCALFGAVPGHPFTRELVAQLSSVDVGEPRTLGPGYFTQIAKRHQEVTILGRKLFYPYLWTEMNRRAESFPDAYAVHHWGAMWFPPSQAARR